MARAETWDTTILAVQQLQLQLRLEEEEEEEEEEKKDAGRYRLWT